ncbi:unnamed protein product (macronuclear) [Paramecium tetraurelia]|uniref:Leucine Rich Repeat family protein n=1 Tax=Paramecium tetraurelia TaxID=5888 RepID=A0DKI9_PARTE|nr:uncharacterized protein GSPATT00017886001 [Paramecium tetraurelia]CAK83556.1 unnamed protein product [Paramecium tetraurelia]|eukprot:XP_001450953.1 hypothetical protein (macronuclear) [Paramecium tetraurelia strain d4-2]
MKKDKLKQFFRTDRSISDTKQHYFYHQSKKQQPEFIYEPQTERLVRENQQLNLLIFSKEKNQDFQKVDQPTQRHLFLQKWKTNPTTVNRQVNTQIQDQSSNNSFSSNKTKLFDESESEYEISSNQSSDDDDSDQSSEMRFKDFEKDIDKIQRKISNDLNRSYFGFIKNQDKLKDLIQTFRKRDSVNPLYFYCMNQNLFPKRIDLSNCLIEQKEMNFKDLKVNSKYFPLLSQLLKSKKCKKVKSIILSNNHLREHSLSIFIDSFPDSLKDLNLSQNELGRQGALLIAKLFDKHKNLKSLNIASNLLGDQGAITILNAVQNAKTVKKLNLSQNQITDKATQELQNFLISNLSIEVLILNWNQLGPQSGIGIAKALNQNKNLKVLDLSYNHLGFNEKSNCIGQWCQLIENPNLALCHLDISYNQISEKQMVQLQKSLMKNNNLYGIHVEGNKCPAFIDAFGFLQFSKQENLIKQVQQKKIQIDGVNYIPICNGQELLMDCCWICQGWKEHQFTYTPDQNSEQVPIFLHLDFLDYKPIPMTSSFEMKQQLMEQNKSNKQLELTTGEIIHQLKSITDGEKKITMAAIEEAYNVENNTKNETQNQIIEEFNKLYYTTYQMCPPKSKILYFFSDPLRERYFYDPTLEYVQSPIDDLILQGKDPKHQMHVFADNTQIPFQKINFVNVLNTKQEYVIDDKNNYKPLIKVKPRILQRKYILTKYLGKFKNKKGNVAIWSKDDSLVFRGMIGDSVDILDQAFEYDWGCSKIQRFVKSDYERMKLKEYFRQKYQLIKDIYKYFSSFGYQPPVYDVFCIQFGQFHKILSPIIDGENLKQSDVESDLVSIKNNVDTKFIYNPDKAIIRYQFMEVLFRLANDKFIRSGQCKNFADAVYRLLKELEQHYEILDNSQQWRQERFWTKEVDLTLQFKQPFLRKLYDLASDLTSKKWYFKLKWVSIKEFREFCKLYTNDILSEKQVTVIFNYSMQTQADEVTQDRFLRMTFNEFLEALGRVAEKISPAPIGEDAQIWPVMARQTLPLHIKLESLLTFIFLKLRRYWFITIFRQPEFIQFTDLFCKDIMDAQETRIIFMPKVYEKQSKLENTDEFVITTTQLTVYNTISFFHSHHQPYLHPNYRNFLMQTGKKRTLMNPNSNIVINNGFSRQVSGRTTIFEQQQQAQYKNNMIAVMEEYDDQ